MEEEKYDHSDQKEIKLDDSDEESDKVEQEYVGIEHSDGCLPEASENDEEWRNENSTVI